MSSEAKAGRDAAELAGLKEPTGVIATNDLAKVIDTQPDCAVYTALADNRLPDALEDYRRLLEDKDLHAVLIASPDHWHVPMTIDAIAAGKYVYVEKPLTHKLAEGKLILDAQARHKRVVQVGTQQRSMTHIVRARELVREGKLGTIHKVHLTWNRNTPRAARPNTRVDPANVDWKAWLGAAAPG